MPASGFYEWDANKNKVECRPRRFGKSYAANMLCAYYDCSCDSHKLFDGLAIAKDLDYEKHINKYNVLIPQGDHDPP